MPNTQPIHAYLHKSGDTFTVHSGRTARQYDLTVATGRRVCWVVDCGCTRFYYFKRCSHAAQLEEYLNGKKGN